LSGRYGQQRTPNRQSREGVVDFSLRHEMLRFGDVECEIDIKRRTFLVPLDRDLYRKVQSIARKRGVSAETLLNMWILEKAS
jgi:hypothetical protein